MGQGSFSAKFTGLKRLLKNRPIIGLENQFLVFLRVAGLQVLLYNGRQKEMENKQNTKHIIIMNVH